MNNKVMRDDGPIDPSKYRSWIFVKHSNDDNGGRPVGWKRHNEFYEGPQGAQPGDKVNIKVRVANAGWANAPLVNVDIFVPVGSSWLVFNDVEQLSIDSGEEKRLEYEFTAGPGYSDDTDAPSFQPSIIIRVCDLFTPVPSRAEIMSCLELLKTNYQGAIDTLREWKRMPGFFVYPCCALFP